MRPFWMSFTPSGAGFTRASGEETRALGPSSRPLRGGHILVQPPVASARGSQPVTFVVESTNLGKVEELQLQYAEPCDGRLDARSRCSSGGRSGKDGSERRSAAF